MRQFFYLGVFGGGAYAVFSVLSGNILQWPISVTLALFAFALAFVPIEERGLDEWLINFIKAIYKPTQRIWKKEPALLSAFSYQNLSVLQQELITLAPTTSRRKLEEYLQISTDEKQDPLDMQLAYYSNMASNAFANTSTTPLQVEDIKPLETAENSAGTVSAPTQVIDAVPEDLTQEPVEQSALPQQQDTNTNEAPQPTTVTDQTTTQQEQQIQVEEPTTTTTQIPQVQENTQPEVQESAQKTVQKPQQPQQAPAPTVQDEMYDIPKLKFQEKDATPDFFGDAINSDRRAGRKFTSLLPTSGEIVLPIRGERTLNFSVEDSTELSAEEIDSKTDQLKQLLDQIKADKNYKETIVKNLIPTQTTPTTPAAAAANVPAKRKEAVEQEAKNIVEEIKAENQRLSQEINKIQSEISQKGQSVQTAPEQGQQPNELAEKERVLKQLEDRKAQAIADYEALQQKIQDLQKQLTDNNAVNFQPQQGQQKTSVPASVRPNVITGVVLDSESKAIKGAVMIVKNHKNEPERAIKTDALGQFTISNPLPNGQYTVEVANAEELKLKFEKAFVQILGKVVPPIEFVSK